MDRDTRGWKGGFLFTSLMVVFFIGINTLSFVFRYQIFRGPAVDSAGFLNLLWLISRFEWPATTVLTGSAGLGEIVWGYHLSPIYFLLGLIYRMIPHPEWIIFLKIACVACGVYGIYLSALHILRSHYWACFCSFGFLFSPLTVNSALREMYPDNFAVCFLVFVLYFFIRNKWGWAIFFAGLALSCKEHIIPFLVILGLVALLQGRKKMGWSFILMGFFWFLITLGVMARVENFQLSFFSAFGNSSQEILANLILKPHLAFERIFRFESLYYVFDLLSPTAFLAVFGIEYLLPITPLLLIYLLSDTSAFYIWDILLKIDSHYTSFFVPFIYVAMIVGIRRITSKISQKRVKFFTVLLFITCVLGVNLEEARINFFRLKTAYSMYKKEIPRARLAKSILDAIPESASVSTNGNIAVYLHARRKLYQFPCPFIFKSYPKYDISELEDLPEAIGKGEIEYIVLERMRMHHPFLRAAEWEKVFEIMDQSNRYRKIADDYGMVVYKKKEPV